MPVPPPPPLPPPVYYPQPSASDPPSNANHTLEEGRHVSQQPPVQSSMEVLWLSVIHNLTQLCLGGVIISALIIPNVIEYNVLIEHIVLCTVGYFILIAQAILLFSPVGWANSLKYETRQYIHGTMQILGSILAISGSAVQLADTKAILETSHGICGLIATIFTAINLIAGLFNFFYNKKRKNKLLKILHLCLGATTISLAFIALILAFHLHYRNIAGSRNANLSIAFTVFALFGILLMALIKNAKRILRS